jgi:membrane-bound lytic murein transglycosylase B
MPDAIGRRRFLTAALGAATALVGPNGASAASFSQWVETFRARARARGISDATYTRVMSGIKPDTSVYALDRAQPEFTEELWQYLNRRVSDWRIQAGKERAQEHAPLLDRIEQRYGVDRYIMLGLWGIESAFGDVIANPKLMRPVIPALAALAWGERRRRKYWEQELLNALVIVERGWAEPKEMVGSWAGAMGHTQWMPEVWLRLGVDFDGDGRVSPFGLPDAFAGTARFLVERGKYKRGLEWGCEVRLPSGITSGRRTFAAWKRADVVRADGEAFAHPDEPARIWRPVPGGPVFLLTRNFFAVKSYNPSDNYTLAIVHLADRIGGAGPFVRQFPGGERTPTLAEIQEIQRRLTALGYNTGGADGRIGNDTMKAVRAFQRKAGLEPADGYAGLKVLAKLRQGG